MSQHVKPAQLTLTPHHLYYILSRLEELDIPIGAMDIRLKDLHTETSSGNYVSFLNQPGQSRRRSDRDSLHSVSSNRSVISGMAAFWTTFGFGGSGNVSKSEKARAAQDADLKYLYSAFTKLPSLRLSPDHRARLIRGYEEFPFDTAVPLFAFKNVQSLEVVDVDFRQFYGWDRLAEQLSLLTVKRAKLEDPTDLITNVVLDDAERRRLRSTRSQPSPALPWMMTSPIRTSLARSASDPRTPLRITTESQSVTFWDGDGNGSPRLMTRSISPVRLSPSRPASSYRHMRTYSARAKRSGSGSSNSSEQSFFAQQAELCQPILPVAKWRFLKYLSLADNALTSITASSLLPLANSLRSLNLSANLFTEIPEGLSQLSRLTSLDLSNCMIESLCSLGKNPLPTVTILKLKSNRLSSLSGIEHLKSLETLHVQDNRISDPVEAARLTGLPGMRRLSVHRNPLTRRNNYRITIFNLFRNTPGFLQDIMIDDCGPKYAERKGLQERAPSDAGVTEVRLVEAPQLLETPKRPMRTPLVSTSPVTESVTEKLYGEHSGSGSSRRRRAPRRRIVDLSREEEREATAVSSPSDNFGPPLVSGEVVHQDDDTSLPSEVLSTHQPPSRGIPTCSTSPDDFRRRIEDLKLEVGDEWLSVLREQGWDGSADLVASGNAIRPLGHPLRTMQDQTLVSRGAGTVV